jgi:excisionase family DNA binding protein
MSSNLGGQFSRETTGLPDLIDGKMRALRVSDVATLLNISERQVYKLAAENLIPHFRISGSIRFDPAAISSWLRQKMSPAELFNENRWRA